MFGPCDELMDDLTSRLEDIEEIIESHISDYNPAKSICRNKLITAQRAIIRAINKEAKLMAHEVTPNWSNY